MIRVDDVVRSVPHFDTFCSVAKLYALVAQLAADPRFDIEVAGTSGNGLPIHHVRFGRGAVKALVVAGPHAPEAVGSLTVFSLLTLLQQSHEALIDANVEWHVVPCIDPDGALLNEGWSQERFTLRNYMSNFHLQAPPDQVDTSFPIAHKKLAWHEPSREAAVLRDILDRCRPDFFFSLHNASFGGAFYFLSRDMGGKYYGDIHRLLERHRFPIEKRPIWQEMCAPFAAGIAEMWTVGKFYDYLERTVPAPEKSVRFGAGSWDHLAHINPRALIFVSEMGYLRHPDGDSERDTGQNRRQFMLRLDADARFLTSVLMDEWEKVRNDVDTSSPFHRALIGSRLLPTKEELCEGRANVSRYPPAEILFNPKYDRAMTAGDRLHACIDYAYSLFSRHQLVRLLKASPRTRAVREALTRLEPLFEQALRDTFSGVDLDAFEVVDCDTLARVQLGSGLIALSSVIEERQRAA